MSADQVTVERAAWGRTKTADDGDPLAVVAARIGATRTQVALAWLLHRSPVIIAIPGTSSLTHLEENITAGQLALNLEDYTELSGL